MIVKQHEYHCSDARVMRLQDPILVVSVFVREVDSTRQNIEFVENSRGEEDALASVISRVGSELSWFGQRVRTGVENSATVARSYVEEQTTYMGEHMLLMAQGVNSAAPAIGQSPVAFGHYLASETRDNGFSAAYVLDRDGRVLARAEGVGGSPFLAPPPASFAAADKGDISAQPFESADLFRALKVELEERNRWAEQLAPMPYGRAGKPEEVADMVAFLASDRSAYTAGTIITIDGGAVNRGSVF